MSIAGAVAVDFVDNLLDSAIRCDQSGDLLVKCNGKPIAAAANHAAGYLDDVIESEQWKLQHDGLIFPDASSSVDEHARWPDVSNDVAKNPFLYGVFRYDVSGPARGLALV